MAEQRLIDANNLIEEIREERCYNCRNFKDMKCDYCGTADYIYMIEDMPTVEAKPVVHAHWEEYWDYNYDNYSYCCSNCGKDALTKEGTMYDQVLTKLCPYCGAQMDEKEDKHEDYT